MLKLTQTIITNLRSNNKTLLTYKLFKSTVAEASEIRPDEIKNIKTGNRMVAAAFASLKPISKLEAEISTPVTDEKITKATNVNELLAISEGSGISRRHALKVVSTLAEWSSSGKVKVSDFENDSRFVKLCRILSKGAKINRNIASRSEDLSTILMVTADDEAARLISGLNLGQMVKVMTTLTVKKRRSVLLLRTLAYNITASGEQLDLKQSADLLYSMCHLNFIDENLLSKICTDVTFELKKDIEKSAVIGSIVTSLGLLKYKNCEILDALSDWILNNYSLCRPQDVFSLFITLATVNYLPNNSDELFKVLLPQLSLSEARKPPVWLNYVWALVVFNQASPSHLSSVLAPDFVSKFEGAAPSKTAGKLKLLNINASAKLMKNYEGDLLSPLSDIHDVSVTKSKEKTKMADSVVDTLKNLINLEDHLHVNVNTGFGCSIDAECLLDKKCNPLPYNKGYENRGETFRIAILAFDYHDMCIGKVEPSGVNALACRLLQSQNYKVVTIPYTEFKVSDKLVHRVQYLETKLKNVVK
ncbi:FAST kinase domain-containing protein 4 [Zophobas morio]|uniref:FAST kinase domain-containing protein 4 n=1 Tax=Zophobas morio TaxID=2755281 RepID=UPI003083230E